MSISIARGGILVTYDLDSLVKMSSAILEGKIVGEHRMGNDPVWDFEIMDVGLGHFANGQKIEIAGLDRYCGVLMLDRTHEDLSPLKMHDELFIFLEGGGSVFSQIATNIVVYSPVESGVKFISRGKVVGFWQWSYPGGYAANITGVETNSKIPSVADFRNEINDSIKRVAQWNRLLTNEADLKDIPALLELLSLRVAVRPRGFRDYSDRDDIAETVIKHLADLQEPAAILRAGSLLKEISFEDSIALGQGLATARGRSFLFAKVTDKSEPMENRSTWSGLLFWAAYRGGNDLLYKPIGVGTNQANVNEHYLTKIAELATNEQTDMGLRMQLLNSLVQLACVQMMIKVFVTDDGKEAEAVLESFSKQTESQQFKYFVDLISCGTKWNEGRSDYEPVISIIKNASYQPQEKTILYALEYSSYKEGLWKGKLIVQNPESGARREFAIGQINGISRSVMSERISVPIDIPHGRYRVFAEFYDGAKLVATSHFSETDL